MTDQDNSRQVAALEEANENLKASLKQCRELLSECRSKLAANANDAAAQAPDARAVGKV